MSKVEQLTDTEALASASRCVAGVFGSVDPFGRVFQTAIEARAIAYPVSFDLNEAQWAGLANAAREFGDDVLYATETEAPGRTWALGSPFDYPYRDLFRQGWTSVTENAVVSGSGSWGVLIAHTEHALLGGPPDFVARVCAAVPEFGASGLSQFLEEWARVHRERPDLDLQWVGPLLEDVFGQDRGHELVSALGEPRA